MRGLQAISMAALMTCGAPLAANPISDWAELQTSIAKASESPDADFAPARFESYPRLTLAMFEAANMVEPTYRSFLKLAPVARGASGEAAVATAAHDTLLADYPDAKDAVENAYLLVMADVPAGPSREAGIAAGKAAAAAARAAGGVDPALAPGTYRPAGNVGQFVPVGVPFDPALSTLKPWVMKSADALRLPPPPDARDPAWVRSFEEVKTLGGKDSTARTPLQTLRAKFWSDYDLDPVVRQVADQPGRSLVRNARLYAMLALADHDDTLMMVDGKAHYQFWRPLSAIRNAEADGNPATTADPAWRPLLRTPGQPEYPCGHCSFAAVVGTILAGDAPPPPGGYHFTSATKFPGVALTVPTMDAFIEQVSVARIHGGVHFRSTMDASIPRARTLATMVIASFPPLKK